MSEYEKQMLQTVQKMLGLLELLAEDKIAQRDAQLRATLREIAGGNQSKRRAILLMNGTRAPKDLVSEASIDRSDLSKLLGRLQEAKLLQGEKTLPKLAIPVPSNFFETDV